MFLLNHKIFFAALLLSLIVGTSGFADSIFLKDGREIKGEVIQNDASGVLIEYMATPTIKDQQTFAKSDILRIVAVTADDKAFASLGSLATPDTVLDTTFYDDLIGKKIPEFLTSYPYSRHIAELREDLHSLNAERDRVIAGDRRINGIWITAGEVAADPYETKAKIAYSEIKQSAETSDPITTLKAYELFEKNYPGSSVFPNVIDLALRKIEVVQDKIIAARKNYDFLTKKRQAWIDTATVDQAKEVNAAIEKESLIAKGIIDTATKDGTKFFPVFPNNKDALDQLQAILLVEKARILALQAIPMRQSLKASSDASKLLSSGRFKEAQSQLDSATTLWPANALLPSLKSKLENATKAVKILPSPSPTPVLTPSHSPPASAH